MLRTISMSGQTYDEHHRLPFFDQFENTIEAPYCILVANRGKRVRQTELQITHSNTDALLAEIESQNCPHKEVRTLAIKRQVLCCLIFHRWGVGLANERYIVFKNVPPRLTSLKNRLLVSASPRSTAPRTEVRI